jgi:cell filamentation protein
MHYPFIEGNGRTNRSFFRFLAHKAGYQIDLAKIDPEAWNRASVEGFHGNYDPMAKILLGTITGRMNL